MKSGGVPGLTVGRTTPSWWEWIRVSSRSSTRTCKLYESHGHLSGVLFLSPDLFPHHVESVSGDGGERGDVILDGLVLLDLGTGGLRFEYFNCILPH